MLPMFDTGQRKELGLVLQREKDRDIGTNERRVGHDIVSYGSGDVLILEDNMGKKLSHHVCASVQSDVA